MSHQKVKNVMSTDVATVGEDTVFKDIVRTLAQRDVSAAPVVDAAGRVLGVVSQADLLIKQGTQELDFSRSFLARLRDKRNARRATATTARQLMTAPAITVDAESTVAGAARVLSRHNVKRLPVVDAEGKLVGIVSRKDLLTVFLRKDEDIHDEIVRRVFQQGIGIAVSPATVTATVHDGEVTLTGHLELKSQLALVEEMTRHIDGVVAVTISMSYRHDDTHGHLPESMTIDITHEPWVR